MIIQKLSLVKSTRNVIWSSIMMREQEEWLTIAYGNAVFTAISSNGEKNGEIN